MPAKADPKHVAFAKSFANLLVTEKFDEAHALLSQKLKASISEMQLGTQFKEMISYGTGPAHVDGHTNSMNTWPNKKTKDLAWVYVSISGDDFAEAIAVVISVENGHSVVSEIEWGRP